MERNEVLKTAIAQNTSFKSIESKQDVIHAVDILAATQNSACKVNLKSILQDIIIEHWTGQRLDLEAVIKEINLISERGSNNAKQY